MEILISKSGDLDDFLTGVSSWNAPGGSLGVVVGGVVGGLVGVLRRGPLGVPGVPVGPIGVPGMPVGLQLF